MSDDYFLCQTPDGADRAVFTIPGHGLQVVESYRGSSHVLAGPYDYPTLIERMAEIIAGNAREITATDMPMAAAALALFLAEDNRRLRADLKAIKADRDALALAGEGAS